MKAFVVLAALACLMTCPVKAQENLADCENVIRYNTQSLDTNYAAKLAVWDTVDQDMYNKAQTTAGVGVVIYGIPINLSWDQFNEARSRLHQSMALSQSINTSSNSRFQAVDSKSVDAYIACIDRFADKKFTAKLLTVARNTVSILIKKVENPGQLNKDYVEAVHLVGGQADRKKIILAGSPGWSVFTITRQVGQPLDVSLVLFSPDGVDLGAADFSVPKFTNITNNPIQVHKKSNVSRCEHTFEGPAETPLKVFANASETLMVETKHVGHNFLGGSANKIDVNFTNVSPTVIEGNGTCASNDNNRAATYEVWIEVDALQDNFVDQELAASIKASTEKAIYTKRRLNLPVKPIK